MTILVAPSDNIARVFCQCKCLFCQQDNRPVECSIPTSIAELWGGLRVSSGAGKFAIIKTSEDLSAAILESDGVSVGKDKSSLSVVEKELNTVDVCAAFGLLVKFTVSLDEPGVSCSLLDVSKNTFEVMMQCCQICHFLHKEMWLQ